MIKVQVRKYSIDTAVWTKLSNDNRLIPLTWEGEPLLGISYDEKTKSLYIVVAKVEVG